jgi:hypothetical protein
MIAAYLESVRVGRAYLEPFAGSASVLVRMTGERYVGDVHPDLILHLTAVRDGMFQYPDHVSEERYCQLRHAEPSALSAFVGVRAWAVTTSIIVYAPPTDRLRTGLDFFPNRPPQLFRPSRRG